MKVLKTTIKEYKPNGEFLRFNVPVPDFPDDTIIRWVGQNDKFGIVEVYSDEEDKVVNEVKEKKNVEEIEMDTSYLIKINEENIDNLQIGNDKVKALKNLKEKYGKTK